jgi:hypothetical protein
MCSTEETRHVSAHISHHHHWGWKNLHRSWFAEDQHVTQCTEGKLQPAKVSKWFNIKTDIKNQTNSIIHFNVPGMQKYRLLTSFKCLIGLSF